MKDYPDFPELVIEDEQFYRDECVELSRFFAKHQKELGEIHALGRRIIKFYQVLEPFFHEFTESVCHCCAVPCCVNRHGFPDFEDLVLFLAMGQGLPDYNFNVIDTDKCQFLGPNGCSLPRQARSYRCTWYFCDHVLDEFEHLNSKRFHRFDVELERLGRCRSVLLERFSELWFLSH